MMMMVMMINIISKRIFQHLGRYESPSKYNFIPNKRQLTLVVFFEIFAGIEHNDITKTRPLDDITYPLHG